jgi:mono/diheme cytochrome c family protein
MVVIEKKWNRQTTLSSKWAWGVCLFLVVGWSGVLQAAPSASEIKAGKALFSGKGCQICHSVDGSKKMGPTMKGIAGQKALLVDGRQVLRDRAYFRTQLTNPKKYVVKGFPPVMPSYASQLSKPQIRQLVSYLMSLGGTVSPKVTQKPAVAAKKPTQKPTKKPASLPASRPVVRVRPSLPQAAPGKVAQRKVSRSALALGRYYYRLNCAFCHGVRGAGDGPGGKALGMKVKDFSKGQFLYGNDPKSIYNIIMQGSPRTKKMPAWRHLSEKARWALVSYLLSLRHTPNP